MLIKYKDKYTLELPKFYIEELVRINTELVCMQRKIFNSMYIGIAVISSSVLLMLANYWNLAIIEISLIAIFVIPYILCQMHCIKRLKGMINIQKMNADASIIENIDIVRSPWLKKLKVDIKLRDGSHINLRVTQEQFMTDCLDVDREASITLKNEKNCYLTYVNIPEYKDVLQDKIWVNCYIDNSDYINYKEDERGNREAVIKGLKWMLASVLIDIIVYYAAYYLSESAFVGVSIAIIPVSLTIKIYKERIKPILKGFKSSKGEVYEYHRDLSGARIYLDKSAYDSLLSYLNTYKFIKSEKSFVESTIATIVYQDIGGFQYEERNITIFIDKDQLSQGAMCRYVDSLSFIEKTNTLQL